MRSAFLVSLALVLTLSSGITAWAGDGHKRDKSIDCDGRIIKLEPTGVVVRSAPFGRPSGQIESSSLGNSELVKAAKLSKLGGFYRERGLYIKAEPLLLEAIGVYSRVLGVDHPETKALLKTYAMPVPHDWARENEMLVAAIQAARQRAAARAK